MVVAVALSIVVMVVLVLVVMVVAVALLVPVVVMVVLMFVIVIVIVAVALDVLVQLVVEAGVVDGVEHPVPQLVLVDVDHGAHEREADLLHGIEGPVVLDPVVQVGEVEGDPRPVLVDDSRLDVSEEAARLLGDPLADVEEGVSHPRLRVGVPSGDGSLQTDGAAVRVLERGVLVLMVVIVAVALLAVVMVVLVLAHLIIS